MRKGSAWLAVFATLATPALAFDITEIGRITADFDGEDISQPTVIAKAEDETSSTAYLTLAGPFSSLSLTGYSKDNARIDISVTFMSVTPGVETPPVDVDISYAPTGTKDRWIAYEAPGTDNIAFTTFTLDGDEGHVTGTFQAKLCYTESYEDDGDPNNCRPIAGSFDTPITIEQ